MSKPERISISPFLLLEAIRDGRLRNHDDVKNLRRGRWLHARYYFECQRAVAGFEKLELLEVDNDGTFRLTDKVELLLETFALSPSQMSVYSRDSLLVNPIFGRPPKQDDDPNIFVLMPLATEMRSVYNDHIKRVAERTGKSIARADDFFSASAIIDDIWSAINGAEVIIADCTGQNPNVFYEIGVAHTLGKPVITISQTLDDVPFDVKHRRAILYETTASGMVHFEEKLAKTLKSELLRAYRTDAANEILNKNYADSST